MNGTRRAFGALIAAACLTLARCSPRAPEVAPAPLALAPSVDLVPAAGLTALTLARPAQLRSTPALAAAVDALLPDADAQRLASRTGGVDVRSLDELLFARFGPTTLVLARGNLDRARVEAAFAHRVGSLDGRTAEGGEGTDGAIVRAWGSLAAPPAQEQLALFGRTSVGFEHRESPIAEARVVAGPLRAAELFARRKLARAKPALRSEPLASLATLLGDAPLLAMWPGPFDDERGEALGTLARTATAVGISVSAAGTGSLRMRVVVTGDFGEHAPRAAAHLAGIAARVMNSSVGTLAGLDRPLRPLETTTQPGSISMTGEFDPNALAHGLRAMTSATIDEVLRD